MNVKTLIDDRIAIPIRAIPFVTGGKITPDLVASIFAHTDPWESRLSGVAPYHLSDDGTYSPMRPKEWDAIELKFKLLLKKFIATKKINPEHQPILERKSIPVLPSACFVWKDDFEKAFQNSYSARNYEILDERPGDRELNFSPYIPRNLRTTVMKGFPKTLKAVTPHWPWGDYENPLLRILAGAVEKWCLAEEYPQKKTGEVQEWIKAEMKKAGMPPSNGLADRIETIISPRQYSHTRQRVNRKG